MSKVSDDLRIDAEYFKKRYLHEDSALSKCELYDIRSMAFVTDGPHGYHEVDDRSPVAMLTAKCAAGWFAERQGADTVADWVVQKNRRSILEVSDIILSTRGTVGKCALVTQETLPAIIDQDVARISLNADNEYFAQYLLTYLNSQFGQDHIVRNASGMVQQGMSLEKVRSIPIPRLSQKLQAAIANTVNGALAERRQSEFNRFAANEALLFKLGLTNWAPPEPLVYTASSADVFASGRLDAQFFTPRIQQLIDHLSGAGATVGTVATSRREKFDATRHGDFDYIEIGDLDGTGTTRSSRVTADEAPSRATWFVRPGDIITSTVRPIRRLSAQIEREQDGFVCSSGFVVLDPIDVQPELLLTYLRLPVICELMDLFASASMYPAISEADILALPFPAIDDATEQAVVAAVKQGRASRACARDKLDAAKQAIEIAIEDSEAAALTYLDRMGDA